MCDDASSDYSASLKEAMEKIKFILDEYEIGGNIFLTSRTHAEYLYHFPEWSRAQWEKETTRNGQSIRIKSKRKDFKSKEDQMQAMTATAHLIATNRDMAAQTFDLFQNLFKLIESKMEIKHKAFSRHTPHFIH